MIEVALFPIPNSVNFPGVPISLHVFEPRYRKMVKYCIHHNMMMGVCHTEKVVHAKTRDQTQEEVLSSNQSTYKPCAVFSAGKVELLEEMDDGRMVILVNFETRLKLQKERQTLPFNIWACKPYEDEPLEDENLVGSLKQSHEKIMQRLMTISYGNDEVQKILANEHWQNMSSIEFSFLVNGLIAMPAEIKQDLLEMRRPKERLDAILKMVNSIK
ncbi:MAG: LON peptidase substrate-binding domain-containing protein, partial [Pseudomonadota bacterium]|nr:LON peptidase substrate-binding domain-containing protein [Pseudomonadota bacterium]